MKMCYFNKESILVENYYMIENEHNFRKSLNQSLAFLALSVNSSLRRFISQVHFSLCFTLSVPQNQSSGDSAPNGSVGGNI